MELSCRLHCVSPPSLISAEDYFCCRINLQKLPSHFSSHKQHRNNARTGGPRVEHHVPHLFHEVPFGGAVAIEHVVCMHQLTSHVHLEETDGVNALVSECCAPIRESRTWHHVLVILIIVPSTLERIYIYTQPQQSRCLICKYSADYK